MSKERDKIAKKAHKLSMENHLSGLAYTPWDKLEQHLKKKYYAIADWHIAEIEKAKRDAVLKTLQDIDAYIPTQTKARERLEQLKQQTKEQE